MGTTVEFVLFGLPTDTLALKTCETEVPPIVALTVWADPTVVQLARSQPKVPPLRS